MDSDRELLYETSSVVPIDNDSSDIFGNNNRKTFSRYLKTTSKAPDCVCEPKTVKDVISIVTEKVQALQRADILIEKNKHGLKLKPFKRNHSVTVSNLIAEYEVPKHRFGSNLVSDTQMVECAEGVEAMLQVMAKSDVKEDKPSEIAMEHAQTIVRLNPAGSFVRDTIIYECNNYTIESPKQTEANDVKRRSKSLKQDVNQEKVPFLSGSTVSVTKQKPLTDACSCIDYQNTHNSPHKLYGDESACTVNSTHSKENPALKTATHVKIHATESIRKSLEQKQTNKSHSKYLADPAAEAILTTQDLSNSYTTMISDSISKQCTEPRDNINSCYYGKVEHSPKTRSPILTSTENMPQQVSNNLCFHLEHFQKFEDAQTILRVKSPFFYASPDLQSELDTNMNFDKKVVCETVTKPNVLTNSNRTKDSLPGFADNKTSSFVFNPDIKRDDPIFSQEINDCFLRSKFVNIDTQAQNNVDADSQNILEKNIDDDVVLSSDEEEVDKNNHSKKELEVKNSHLYLKLDIDACSDVSKKTDNSNSTILSNPAQSDFTCQNELIPKTLIESNYESFPSYSSSSRNNVQFQGFKTANNKHISISDKAYKKTLDIFKDLDKDIKTTSEKNYQHTKESHPNLRNKVDILCNPLKIKDNIMPVITSEKQKSNSLFNINDPFAEDIRCSQLDLIVTGIHSQSDPENYSSNYKSMTNFPAYATESECQKKYFRNKLGEDSVSLCKNPLKETKLIGQPLSNPPYDAFDCDSIDAHDTGVLQKVGIASAKICLGELPMFQTASHKKIDVSKEALISTKHLFESIDCTFEQLHQAKPTIKGIVVNENNSVKNTINSNCAHKSTDAFKRAVPISSFDIRSNDNKKSKSHPSNYINTDMNEKLEKFKNFTLKNTDNQDKTTTSINFNENDHSGDAYITKSNCGQPNTLNSFKILQSSGYSNDIRLNASANEPHKLIKQSLKENNAQVSDFRTTSNKRFYVTEEAFKKIHVMDNNIESDTIINTASNFCKAIEQNEYGIDKKPLNRANSELKNLNLIMPVQNDTDKAKFCGFQTASHKKVYVTTEALKKTSHIFENIDSDLGCANISAAKSTDTLNPPIDADLQLVEFNGFQTLENSQVNVFGETLKSTKSIFNDLHLERNDTRWGCRKSQTSNQPIESDKALAEIINTCTDNYSNIEKASFCGFLTANNKVVDVSDGAINITRKLLTNACQVAIDNKENIPDPVIKKSERTTNVQCRRNSNTGSPVHSFPTKTEHFSGFETASKKKVHVSDEALLKTKNLFQNIDQELKQSTDHSLFKIVTVKKIQEKSEPELTCTEQTFQRMKKEIEMKKDEKDLLLKSSHTAIEPMNTQAIINFNETLHTEDFCDSDITFRNTKNNLEVVATKSHNSQIYELASSNQNVIENVAGENKPSTSPIFQTTCTITKDTTKSVSKRSGSPILSFPKAKKRKTALFCTPYKVFDKTVKTDLNLQTVNAKSKDKEEQSSSLNFIYDFDNTYKKRNEKISLKSLGPMQKEKNYPHSLQYNIDDVLNNTFVGPRNDLNSNILTTECIKTIFLNSVKKKIVPDHWVENHMKMIIWKLISYEICYPDKCKNILTVKNVLEQLKYRYDKELYNVERPALRKILEKDDNPGNLLVLCVSKIFQDGVIVTSATAPTNLELELTDGWYCVKTSIDKLLSKAIVNGKIVVGTKLVTHGAELMNCDQGKSPLEDISNVRLRIHGNSTRRAPYWSKLGYHGNGTLLVNMATVLPDGGKISKMTAFVSRIYPLLYVEKFEDGSTVTRSERLENIHLTKFERERDAKLEKICDEVEKEFYDEMTDSESCENDSESKKREYESGSQIAKMMKKSRDPLEFRANLTNSQSKILSDYTNKKRDKALQDIQERIREKIDESGVNSIKRNVLQLLKVRLIGFRVNRNSSCKCNHNLSRVDPSSFSEVKSCNCQIEVTKCLMSVWKPNENVADTLKEGSFVTIYNCIPTAVRMSEVHISAGRQTIFKRSNEKDPLIVNKSSNYIRKVLNIEEVVKKYGLKTEFNEVDVVGLIFEISPSNMDFEVLPCCKRTFQNVYLCDKSMNFISVNFWGGLSKFGYGKILQQGQFVACSNLQIRTGNTKRNIPEFRATEFTILTQHPKSKIQVSSLDTLKRKFANENLDDFCKQCVEHRKRISQKNDFSPYRLNNPYEKNQNCIKTSGPDTPHIGMADPLRKRQISDSNDSDFPKVESYNNASNKICSYQEEYNLSLEDFESTFRHTQDNSCNIKNPTVLSKISKLNMYGEPPPLNTIPILNKTKRVELPYVSPVSNQMSIANNKFVTVESPKTSRVSSPKIATEDSLQVSGGTSDRNRELSPILTRKTRHLKTKPKRIDTGSINLNINSNENFDSNQFSEEFDFSPPLSLD